MRPLLILLFGAAAAFSQPFSAGVKVGIPLTDFVNAVNSGTFNATSSTQRYIVGVTGELHLPLGLGIEGDVLYRRFTYNISGIGFATGSTSSSAWEFPLLLKYKFPTRIVRPYVDGGVAWDHVEALTSTIGSALSLSTASNKPTTMGAVFGVGVEVKALVIRISPEIRFTRWTDQHFNVTNVLHSNQSQAEFLVGITF